MKIREIYDFLNTVAPYDTQCDWDNSGLMTGSLDEDIDSVLLALDCTNDVAEQAKANNCRLIVCHHPLIFSPPKSVEKGTPLYDAIKNDITVISAHTNLDMAKDGVNDVLCERLNIKNAQTLFAEGAPLMRMGDVPEMSAKRFAAMVRRALGESLCVKDFPSFKAKSKCDAVQLCSAKKTVSRVAVCGGAGGEYIKEAFDAGCDTFVTGEAKHHEFLEAKRLGINLIVAGHFSTEAPVLEMLCDKILKKFPKLTVCAAYEECPYETVV